MSMMIGPNLIKTIRELLPPGKTILELGSGDGTAVLVNHYTVYSVEHDPDWVGAHNSHYIHATIKNGWYDADVLRQELPKEYDLLLIDGPPGYIGRQGILDNLDLFNLDVPIIVDDVHRSAERDIFTRLSAGRQTEVKPDNLSRSFGVIL